MHAVLAVALPAALQGVAWGTILTTLVNWLLATFGVSVVAWLGSIIPGPTQHLFAWLKYQASRVKNQYVAGVLQRLSDLALQKVLMIEQTEIQLLKDQAAAGKLDVADLPSLLSQAKQKAIDAAKVDASASGLLALALQIFGGSDDALTKWLGETVESHVATLPPSGLQTTSSGAAPAVAKAVAPAVAQALQAPASPQKAAP